MLHFRCGGEIVDSMVTARAHPTLFRSASPICPKKIMEVEVPCMSPQSGYARSNVKIVEVIMTFRIP